LLTLANAVFQLQRKPSFSAVDPATLKGLVNEACEMMDVMTKPKDSLDRVGITAYDQTLTLPRGYACCEGILHSKFPLIIRSGWFEFSLAGPGSKLETDDGALDGEVADMGDGFCCFREPSQVNAAGCRLKVYTDAQSGAETYESIIEFYGLDADGEIIRTSGATAIRSGEALDLLASSGNATTTASFARITQVVKPITSGIITVYAIDPDDSTEHLIASYEPSERTPNYRRYRVPKPPTGDTTQTVTALCRRRYVEAVLDNDKLCVDHFGALYYGVLSITYRDANDDERSDRTMAKAMDILSRQAVKFYPTSQRPPPIINLDEIETPSYQTY